MHKQRRLLPWLAVALLVAGCSTPAPRRGGLILMIGTDMEASLDAVRIEVLEGSGDGTWQPMGAERLRVPQDARLPTTYGILAGQAASERALVRLIAEKDGAPLVLREAQIDVPHDRLAEVSLLACAGCLGSLRIVGGEAQSACGMDGWSCQPATGTCGPEVIDQGSLPTYSPGDESRVDIAANCRPPDAGSAVASDDAGSFDATPPDDAGSLDATSPDDASSYDATLSDAMPSEASSGDDAAPDASSDASAPDSSPGLVWPNSTSASNSDPWISTHHSEIVQMQPSVLLLNFDNDTLDPAVMASLGSVAPATRFAQVSAAFAEGSRYHGSSTPDAPSFLVYKLAKEVDLIDPTATGNSPYHNSTLLPRRASPCAPNCGTSNPYVFDYSALFTDTYARLYGFVDPLDASRSLNLCQLFQRGVINEVWIYAESEHAPADTDLDGSREYQQVYDATDKKIPGAFLQGFRAEDAPAVEACGVTIRVMGLNPSRGVGCTIWANAQSFEALFLAGSIVSQIQSFSHFANYDFSTRLGAPFSSWYDICDFGSPCAAYTGLNAVTWTRTMGGDGGTGTFDPFDQGCGNVHFPPNATGQYDYGNTTAVQADCQHFGLHDGPQGQDAKDTYTAATVAALEGRFPQCGGGWLVYWYQSFPGLNNYATWGTAPIKNWWPYLFY